MTHQLQFSISDERYQEVSRLIDDGSEPAGRFYIMVAVSTMIAGFGLITNSTAVIIGAMLVAPLMTPIFGIALALIRGDTKLLGKALIAEIVGVFASVLMGFVLGMLYPGLEPTPEILSRTQPQLFDLLVAIFAGFAGAYAMVDEKLSPALPGVAIATAIVPPLANTGLCFALGAYSGGIGSFLLFFANFLSVLLVAAATFWFFGMVRGFDDLSKKVIMKRFGLPILCFVLVALFLSNALFKIVQERNRDLAIESVLREELANLPATGLDKMIYRMHEDTLYILAHVHSANILSPAQVSRIQERLTEKLKETTELILRNATARDVSALGSDSQVVAQDLDGFFVSKKPHPNVLKTKIADSVIRNYFAVQLGYKLYDVQFLQIETDAVLLATITGFIPLPSEEIHKIESMIREKSSDHNLTLVIRFIKTDLRDKGGLLQYEWTTLKDLTAEQQAVVEQVKTAIHSEFEKRGDIFLTGMTHTLIKDTLYFFLKVAGTKVFSKDDVIALERKVSRKNAPPIKINVWFKPETVVSAEGYESFEAASRRILKERGPKFQEEMRKILESSKL